MYCRAEDCKWWKDLKCSREEITITCSNECKTYVCYTDTDAYKEVFWKACGTKENAYREKWHGKRISIGGLEFYTEDDDRCGWAKLTEKQTGMSTGCLMDIENKIDEIKSKIPDYPDVTSYPKK